MPQKYTDHDWEDALKLYKKGYSLDEIAKETRISRISLFRKAKAEQWGNALSSKRESSLTNDKLAAVNIMTETERYIKNVADQTLKTGIAHPMWERIVKELEMTVSLERKSMVIQHLVIEVQRKVLEATAKFIDSNANGMYVKAIRKNGDIEYGQITELLTPIANVLNSHVSLTKDKITNQINIQNNGTEDKSEIQIYIPDNGRDSDINQLETTKEL